MLLIDKMKSYVDGLDIEVKLVSPTGNFSSKKGVKQMAKLSTDENGNMKMVAKYISQIIIDQY